MNREYHLTFCRICNNRKKDFQRGIICSLTNDVAGFEEYCPTFELDSSELDRIKAKINEEINDEYTVDNIDKIFGLKHGEFKRPKMSRNPKYKSIEKTHNLTFKDNVESEKKGLVIMILGLLYLFIVNYNDIISSTLKNGVLIGFGVFLIMIPLFTYRVFFMKLKTKIRINKSGIEYYEKHLNWNDIIDLGILEAKNSSGHQKKIILGTINKGIQEIDLTGLNVDIKEFTDIIILNTKYVS